MTTTYKSVIHTMLPTIFQYYKDHGFYFIIIKLSGYDRESLEIVTSSELADFEKDSGWTVRHIENFKDMPELYYPDFAACLREHLEYI